MGARFPYDVDAQGLIPSQTGIMGYTKLLEPFVSYIRLYYNL